MGGNRLTHVSLFSGIGGLDLAAELAGFETILQVEMNEYATKVLEKHWPNVPRIKDVREVTRGSVDKPITVISGGFPCQPFSVAGKRSWKSDERNLWPEMWRIINDLRPAWVVAENVAGIISAIADEVIESLEDIGYAVWTFVTEAACYGAGHRRERVWFVAYDTRIGMERLWPAWEQEPQPLDGEVLSVCNRNGQWKVEPDVRRITNGVSNRAHRLRCIGNAVVPQQAMPIFKAIAEVEKRG